jgi:hypothetical protein
MRQHKEHKTTATGRLAECQLLTVRKREETLACSVQETASAVLLRTVHPAQLLKHGAIVHEDAATGADPTAMLASCS